jgi:putative membrane protein
MTNSRVDSLPPSASGWQRLNPKMLLVHPVHEVLRQLPVLVGTLVWGTATGNFIYTLAALGLTVALGLARWFTTSYRIDEENVALRAGVLVRRQISVPRSRIRSVQTDARPLHRLLGLTVVHVSTGRQTHGERKFELDAVDTRQVPQLRAILLAESLPDAQEPADAGRVLARWRPSWLRFSALSLSGLVMIVGALGAAYQSGLGAALQNSRLTQSGVQEAHRWGVGLVVVVVGVGLVIVTVLLSVIFSLLTYGNLVLRRDADVLHLRHGLLRVREDTLDMRRLRGGTLRQPLFVRALGGARLDAVMTGVGGESEASVLLPPCPAATAEGVLTELTGAPAVVTGPLRKHGLAAVRRRWTRALALPAVLAVALAVAAQVAALASWVWPAWAVLTVCCLLLAADRVRSLGHRAGDGWLVARAGSLDRRRDCIASAGIIGWTVRQTVLQRRAGVATLVAATAAGRKRYHVIDVPAREAWSIAAAASPWVGRSVWARQDRNPLPIGGPAVAD